MCECTWTNAFRMIDKSSAPLDRGNERELLMCDDGTCLFTHTRNLVVMENFVKGNERLFKGLLQLEEFYRNMEQINVFSYVHRLDRSRQKVEVVREFSFFGKHCSLVIWKLKEMFFFTFK